MKVISIINQKGGVGKTTTAVALWSGLNRKGYKTLGMDLDSQCNFTYVAGAAVGERNVYQVLNARLSASDAVFKRKEGDIITGTPELATADVQIKSVGKEYKLKEALEPLGKKYDFIVIDTPPALGILTVNALTASDSAIIPIQADIFSIEGVRALQDTVSAVRKYCNPSLRIDGLLLTRYSPRAILSREVADAAKKMAESMGTKLYRSTIREAIAIKESQLEKASIFSYAPDVKVAKDYGEFVEEVLEDIV